MKLITFMALTLIITFIMALTLTACAGMANRDVASVGFTYGTIKQIESGRWTSEAVIKEVERVRNHADLSIIIDTDDIINEIMERSGIESPADRYLAAQFLGNMQRYVLEIDAGDRLVRLDRLLDAVETGARMAQ